MRPSLPIRIALAVLTIPLALFLLIQIQQHILRHRAERLHAEILALQLHPGTFADIQRLQREWGYTAKYDGECTPHHCNYLIGLSTSTDSLASRHNWFPSPWEGKLLNHLGYRQSFILADVRVRDNRMWGADLSLTTEIVDGGYAHGTLLMISISYGPHLSGRHSSSFNASALEQGYQVGQPGACTGCVAGWVSLTPRAPAADIIRLNQFDFTCITRRRQCETAADVIPAAWKEYETTHTRQSPDEDFKCTPPLAHLALEAQNIALATVVPITADETSDTPTAATQFVKSLKGVDAPPPGTRLLFAVGGVDRPNMDPQAQAALGPGSLGRSVLLLYARVQNTPSQYPDTGPCGIFPATPANLAIVQQAILDDPSAGEPYDYPINFP